jgi:hypothetical protein
MTILVIAILLLGFLAGIGVIPSSPPPPAYNDKN